MDSQFVADWSMGDAFAPLGGEDDGLIELLWRNGHVVLSQNLQAPRKSLPRLEKAAVAEEAPWFEYPVVDDGCESLEKVNLFSEMFGEMEPAGAGAATVLGGGELMPPPRQRTREKAGWGHDNDAAEDVVAVTDGGESSSVLTFGSRRSVCGSSHVRTPRAVVSETTTTGDDSAPPLGYGTSYSIPVGSSHHDASTIVASSSLRSRPPGGASAASPKRRRKQSDSSMDHHQPAKDLEYESAAATTHNLTPAKRRRAADVHNLSERRRRDRINEKMKALQELIPHCNKTDKASMLEEAIEYLKSLQLQLQMMWMGGGGVPAPAAGVHQYMQRMASMPGMPAPFMPTAEKSSPVSHLPAANTYACYLAVEHLRRPPPSPMGMMSFYQLGAAKNPTSPVGDHTGAAS